MATGQPLVPPTRSPTCSPVSWSAPPGADGAGHRPPLAAAPLAGRRPAAGRAGDGRACRAELAVPVAPLRLPARPVMPASPRRRWRTPVRKAPDVLSTTAPDLRELGAARRRLPHRLGS